jgi:hypothetical protein
MSRRRPLPDYVWDAIHERLDILAAHDYRIEPLTDYQFRINGVVDIYPVNKRWHDLRSGERGSYEEMIKFIQSKI